MHFIGVTSMSIYAISNDSLRPLGAGQSSLHFRFNGDDKGPTKCEKGSGEREGETQMPAPFAVYTLFDSRADNRITRLLVSETRAPPRYLLRSVRGVKLGKA